MPDLGPPTTIVRASFLEAMAEFASEGRGGAGDGTMLGQETHDFGAIWPAVDGFAQYVLHLRAQAAEDTARRDGFVPSTTLWYVDGMTYIGRVAIRHRLTPMLLELGGHIGYDVRPSLRRRGHATEMLRRALPAARAVGISRALVTCDTDNVASRRVIERNGGVLEDERAGKLRFWIDLDGS